MGENEQGGMLRTIVVLGLVAIIVAAVIGVVMTQKKAMVQRTAEVTSTIQSQVGGNNAGSSSAMPATTTIDAN